MIDILVPHQIGKKEIPLIELADAKKLFAKLKTKPELATKLAAKGVPDHTSLFKVYATTAHGARRLLFFFRRSAVARSSIPSDVSTHQPAERWVLLFYRDKNDVVGRNMSAANPHFERQLSKNLHLALDDLSQGSVDRPRYDTY